MTSWNSDAATNPAPWLHWLGLGAVREGNGKWVSEALLYIAALSEVNSNIIGIVFPPFIGTLLRHITRGVMGIRAPPKVVLWLCFVWRNRPTIQMHEPFTIPPYTSEWYPFIRSTTGWLNARRSNPEVRRAEGRSCRQVDGQKI